VVNEIKGNIVGTFAQTAQKNVGARQVAASIILYTCGLLMCQLSITNS